MPDPGEDKALNGFVAIFLSKGRNRRRTQLNRVYGDDPTFGAFLKGGSVADVLTYIMSYGLKIGRRFSLNASMPSLASSVPQKKVRSSIPISALDESKS